ncbi:succinic semialdehyde dehydrogenase [Corynebacterium propinquum]|uniref:succinic semialdehyde dehydrogenase n=1 Tax=Corynebacterium propinquum TaxID=43769 RepID=UPI0025404A92|nr:succinic semialdehyde dehydrogenase [Corynebacterium propinquum]MDK4257902.1 succinic semialdehyde dehydrogenase [Corynebacterium propinquum]MDK4281866.1 succinic semialdehyde dehydrogenase [Corynebacterium propinquum]MDK4299247.1 succinic semialdehyde dehydrogenase [Corynebacterium propinquum]
MIFQRTVPQRLSLQPLPDKFADYLRAFAFTGADGATAAESVEIAAPFLSQPLGWVPKVGADVAVEAFDKARAVQPEWHALGVKKRAKIVEKFHDLVLSNRELIMDLVQLEMGKARSGAFDEVTDVANNARYYAGQAPRLLRPQKKRGGMPVLTKTYLHHDPKGVVGQISPWNYPFSLGIADAIPALLTGNTVVAKPDSHTPFTMLLIAHLLSEAGLPDGVFTVVIGSGGVVGSTIAENCDFLMFTGSTATGKILAEQVSKRLVGFSAELGGKNPMIVAKDANLDTAVRAITHACLSNTGQLCVSIERIYVEHDIYDEFCEKLAEAFQSQKLGGALDWKNHVGSLVSASQLETVQEFVADAKDAGARVVTGGRARPDVGKYFYEPTILLDVPDSARLLREEVFGPVVYIQPVADMDEAVAAANDTCYGLNSSVFAAPKTAWKIAPLVQAGSVNINDGYVAGWASVDSPIGGYKESGVSRRHGAEGLYKYTEPKTIAQQRGFPIWGPRCLPQKAWSKVLSRSLSLGKKTGLLR